MPLLNEKTVNDILISQNQTANGTVQISGDGNPIGVAHGLDVKQKMLDTTNVYGIDVENGDKLSMNKSNKSCKSIGERIPAFGLLMALISVVCFSIGSVIVKVLTQMHSIQVLVIRCMFQFIFYTTTALIYRYPLCGQSGHRIDLGMRCISGTVSLITIFMAYRLMPLGDAATIHFSSPVFVTIFAYFMLKEPLTILNALTGTITLVGVVIIAKPEFIFGADTEPAIHENRLLGTILASVAALAAAFSMINLRKLKKTPVPVVVMWYSASVIVCGSVILLILQKIVMPTGLWTWTLLVAIGFCGIGDQYFLTVALKYESAGPVSVTRTFNIVLSFIWEVVLLQESIEWTSVLGACLVSSCVVILALVKWATESPQLFDKLYSHICCCFMRDHSNKRENTLKSVPESLRASFDSIDSIAVQSTVHSNAILLKSDDEHSRRA